MDGAKNGGIIEFVVGAIRIKSFMSSPYDITADVIINRHDTKKNYIFICIELFPWRVIWKIKYSVFCRVISWKRWSTKYILSTMPVRGIPGKIKPKTRVNKLWRCSLLMQIWYKTKQINRDMHNEWKFIIHNFHRNKPLSRPFSITITILFHHTPPKYTKT